MPDPFAPYVVAPAPAGPDPFAAYAVGGGGLYDPSRAPVSAEDFTPKPPEGSAVGRFASNLGAAINPVTMVKGAVSAVVHPADTAKAIYEASADQFAKAKDAYDQGRYSEAVGHLGGVIPIVGTAAARAGEQIASGDVAGGLGSSVGLVGSVLAPGAAAKVAPKIAPGLATVGEQLAAKGRAIAPLAKEAAKMGATELASHYIAGMPMGAGAAARFMLRSALQGVGKAAPAVDVAANAGGRLVSAAPTVEDAISSALEDLRTPEPPARITTPPQPDLPAGYTPRTTVPKTAPVAAPAAAPAPVAPPAPSRPYFLRSPEELADLAAAKAEASQTPTGSITINDLPESWKSRVGQNIFPTSGAEGKEVLDAIQQEIKDRGLTIGQAMTAVSKNKNISVQLRSQIQRALSKAGA